MTVSKTVDESGFDSLNPCQFFHLLIKTSISIEKPIKENIKEVKKERKIVKKVKEKQPEKTMAQTIKNDQEWTFDQQYLIDSYIKHFGKNRVPRSKYLQEGCSSRFAKLFGGYTNFVNAAIA